MKKIATLILALFYLSVSTGATVHLTYCMGRLVEEGLLHADSKNCSRCGMEKNEKNGCCKDEVKLLKIDNDQTVPETSLKNPLVFPVAISFTDGLTTAYLHGVTDPAVPPVQTRPLQTNTAVFIRNCVFRI